MPTKQTTVTYLQMFSWTAGTAQPPIEPLEIVQLWQPTVEQYRALYNGVGRDYAWTDRNRMQDEALRQVIQHPAVEVYRLTVDGQTAGYSELDCRTAQQIELAYFGLFPQFTGLGLGRYFLAWTLSRAWSHGPQRVWVHTCDLDHPAALHTYLRAGFSIYHREVIEQPV